MWSLYDPSCWRSIRELPNVLMRAFTEANELASDYRSGIESHLAQMELELLGEDLHVPGLDANARKNVDTFIDFLYRLGAIEQPIAADELFAAQ